MERMMLKAVIEKINQGIANPKVSNETKLWLSNIKGMIEVTVDTSALEQKFAEVGEICQGLMKADAVLNEKMGSLKVRVEDLEAFAHQQGRSPQLDPNDIPSSVG